MPLFHYESFNRRGVQVKGTIDATSLALAKEMLQGQGLMPTKIYEVAGEGQGFSFASLFEKKIEPKTVILFTKQLSVLLKSSVPLLQAMELLIEQFEGQFRRLLVSIKDGLKGGEAFAKELGRYPKVFPPVYVQLVRAGEATGKLDTILLRLTTYLEREAETRKKIKKAMSYPIMMLSFAGIVVVGMLAFLVPQLKGLFTQLKQELPGPTQFLISASDIILGNLWTMVGVLIAAIIAFRWWKSTPGGKYKFHALLLKLPMTSYFSRTKAVVQFSKTLGMLLESGVNLSEALDIVCNIVENKVLTQKLNEARDKIIKEGKIAKYLKETDMFPNIANYMITTGEQSGKLAEMLLTVGNDFEEELKELSDGLTAKLSPIMTLVLGVVIGFIVISIFLPIMSMSDMASM